MAFNEIFSQKVRPLEKQLEAPNYDHDDIRVNKNGYVPMRVRIAMLEEAGEKLRAYRSMYDWASFETVDESYYDPTREPGFDLFDASHGESLIIGNLRVPKKSVKEEIKNSEKEESVDSKTDVSEKVDS